jgi:hypothetical protein
MLGWAEHTPVEIVLFHVEQHRETDRGKLLLFHVEHRSR